MLRHVLALCATVLAAAFAGTVPARGQEAKLSYAADLIPRVNIPHAAKPPTIDGTIGADEWRDAAKVMGMVSTGGLDFRDRPVSFWLAWDESHLYIATRTDILPGHRMYRAHRERFTTNVVFDDSFEFGVFMHDRNKKPNEVSSYLKFILNALGSGEYMKLYPSIGQNMYNWQPDSMQLANRVYEADGTRWWDMEIAMDLKALEMPVANQAGDKVGLLLAADLKNPGWQWLDFPSASGHLVHDGFARATLTQSEPYVQIERFSGLHDEKLDLKSVLYNPTDQPAAVTASVTLQYKPGKDSKAAARTLVDEKRELTIPAKGSVRFDVAGAFPGLDYEFTKWGAALNTSSYRIELRRTGAPADAAPVYSYNCTFAGTKKDYLKADPRTTVFEYDMQYNPVSNRLAIAGDTLDAQIPPGTKPAGLAWAVDKDGTVIKEGRITQFVHLKYEDLIELPALAAGKYRVTLTLLDAAGKPLVSRNDISFEKKDEAKAFPAWWGNRLGDTEKVLKPFAPLTAKADRNGAILGCTRREYRVDGLGLPYKITANGGAVLSAPARIVVTVAGTAQTVPTTGKLKITSAKDWRIEFSGTAQAAGIAFTVKGWMEQDGLVNLDLTYAPEGKTPVAIEDLRVEWPVDDTLGTWLTCIGGTGGNYSARYIGKVPDGKGPVWDTLTNIGKAGSTMIAGNFESNLWLGNEQRGFLWTADSDRGWLPNDKTPAHSLVRDGTSVILRNHLIALAAGDKPFVLDAPRTVQLQYNATPFRHLAKGWRLNQISAANGFAGPDYKTNEKTKQEYFSILSMPSKDLTEWPAYYAKYKARAEGAASPDGYFSIAPRLKLFLTNQIALRGYMDKTVEPGVYDYFRADWMPGNESLNASYRDYAMYLMNRHIREGGVTHFYFDISFSRDTADLVAGFGYRLPDGRVQPGSMDGTLREWYKRVWALTQENNLYPGGVSGHATNSVCLRALPWTDAILDSEYPMRDPITTYPPDRMIALSCPHTFGVKIDHLGFMNAQWAAMHDAGVGGGGGPLTTAEFRQFGISSEGVEFVPYWRNQGVVKNTGQGLLSSIWKRRNGAILMVLNYGLDPQGQEKTRPCEMRLDLQNLGVPAGVTADQLRVRELWNGPQIIDEKLGIFQWYQDIPKSPHPLGWQGHFVKLRTPVAPTLDPATGVLKGGDIFYHDTRAILVTWDDKPVDDSTWKELFAGPLHAAVLDWGIDWKVAKPLATADIATLLKPDNAAVQVAAWRRPDSVLLRLANSATAEQSVKLALDLDKLGLKVSKLWEQFYLPYGLQGDAGGFDPLTGSWSLKLKPGEVRVVTLTRN